MTPEQRRERELRLIGRETREDEEAATAELDAAQRSLADACVEIGSSGSDVVVDTTTGSRRGRIVHVGADLITIASSDGVRVDVALGHVVGLASDRRPGPATPVGMGHPASMIARLRELVQSERVVELERSDASVLRGIVHAVASDHLELHVGSSRWIVPMVAVVALS